MIEQRNAVIDPRESLWPGLDDADNPIGLDGIEFIEYAAARPQALGQVLEMCGFRPVARHRSREVLLYRQGGINIVINAHGAPNDEPPAISAVAFRVRDARAAYERVLDRGGWEVPTHPEAMELNIPAIHGPGASRFYFVDRYREFSIYDVDFIPIPSVEMHPAAVAGIHFFGIVQYTGPARIADWVAFYDELFGMKPIPDSERFGILPTGTLLRAPSPTPASGFFWQLIEPHPDSGSMGESLRRIGLGAPDIAVAVRELRALGLEFLETPATRGNQYGAITKTYLDGISFELVHSEREPTPAGSERQPHRQDDALTMPGR